MSFLPPVIMEIGVNATQAITSMRAVNGQLATMQTQAATTSIAISMRDINDTVDRLLQNQSGIKSATGFGGELQSRIGGTTAANAKADLDRVKSAISLSAIAKMRAESKTGGAVGNMTEKEWPRFESIYGSLDQAQTSDQVIKNLRELKGLTTETQESMIRKYDSIYGGGQDIRKTISTPSNLHSSFNFFISE